MVIGAVVGYWLSVVGQNRERINYKQPTTVLQRILAALGVSNADSFVYARAEYFSIADFAGLRGCDDCVLGLFNHIVREHHFDFSFRDQIDSVFTAAVDLGVPLLPSMAADFDDRHSLHANFVERVFDGFELGRLNDGFDFGHDLGVIVPSGQLPAGPVRD